MREVQGKLTIWLTSADARATALPAAWLIATGAQPATLTERSALRRETARAVLARQLALAPDALTISHDPAGRPVLLHPSKADLHLSLATRAGVVAIGLANRPVGIDVERVDPLAEPPYEVLHPQERSDLVGLDAATRLAAFAQLWAAKEAYVKALGTGFARAPESFCARIDDRRIIQIDDHMEPRPARGWSITMNGGEVALAAAMIVLD